MKKLLICLIMIFAFSTLVSAAPADQTSDYSKLTVIEKMRMPVEVEQKNVKEPERIGASYMVDRYDNSKIEAEAAARAARLSKIIDMTPEPVSKSQVAQNNNLPNVAVIYLNNSKSTYNDDVDKFILPLLGQALPADKYNLIDGAIYLERLNKVGIVDLSTAERADILDAFKGDNVDYIVIMEIQPFISTNKITFFTIGKDITTSIPFKIIDVINGRYLYNGKFTEKASDSSMVGAIGNKSVAKKALNNAAIQMTSVIETRLPAGKPTLNPVK